MTPQGNDPRDFFFYWWPVAARVAGVIGAFAEAAYAIITHQSADAGVLAFCGTMILAPTVFDQQERRNKRKNDNDEDDG
jgi:hypothetical protein